MQGKKLINTISRYWKTAFVQILIVSFLCFIPIKITGSYNQFDCRCNVSIVYLTIDSIKYYLRCNNLDEEWVKVAILESGWKFNSRLSIENKSIFGFNHPQNRPTLSKGNNGFAKYDSYDDCIKDLVLWSSFSPRNKSESFYEWLRKRGFNNEKKHYYEILMQISI